MLLKVNRETRYCVFFAGTVLILLSREDLELAGISSQG